MSIIRADSIKNRAGNGAPDFPNGITVTGIVTSTVLQNNITGDLTISGNLGVGGTVTYEDVTNVDAVGILTARSGIRIGTGGTVGPSGSGIVTYFGDGSQLTNLPAGAPVGGATTNTVFFENDNSVDVSYTITSGKNAMAAEPIEIKSGVTVTVPSGSFFTIV